MYAVSNGVNRSGLRLIAISSLIIGMAACGGGGSSSSSGGGGGGGSTLPTAPVTITSTNQSDVAGAAVDSAINSVSLSTMAVQTSAPAPSAVATALRVGNIGQAAIQQIATQSTGPLTVTGVVQTSNCTVSGTMSIDVAASNTSGTITFNSCSSFAGETINGTISTANIASTATDQTADMTFNLTFTDASGTGTVSGDIHSAKNLTTGATTISGTSLTMSHTLHGSIGLQNYSITTNALGSVTAMTFTFASTVAGGTATFSLVTPFSGTGQFPSSGSGIITGAGSTKLKLTVLGDETAAATSQVQLELSTDNGTTYGTPALVTWASISSNL